MLRIVNGEPTADHDRFELQIGKGLHEGRAVILLSCSIPLLVFCI